MTPRRCFLWILVIGIAVGIFLFSGQDGDTSRETSSRFTEPVVRLVEEVVGPVGPIGRDHISLRDLVDFAIRKAAHFSEYAAFAASLLLLLRDYGVRRQKLFAWLIATAYAGTDELHQMLDNAGRSGQIQDVGIDSLGALTGMLLMALILRWITAGRGKAKQARHDEKCENT